MRGDPKARGGDLPQCQGEARGPAHGSARKAPYLHGARPVTNSAVGWALLAAIGGAEEAGVSPSRVAGTQGGIHGALRVVLVDVR